ncbi:MAG: trimethylamine methyltransferase family protein [Desulfobacterales bacterium]|nr:trimethylamine methyltransferase family protein [Desulfobacterales bacterium]
MFERMTILKEKDFEKLHEATLRVYEEVGIAFHSDKALDVFKKHGIRVDGNKVHFTAQDVDAALKTAPSQFKIHARNPEKSVTMGGNNLVVSPGYGAPFVMEDGEQRPAVLEDYVKFCKLVQTSKYIDMNGMLMGDPSDKDPDTRHLDMVFSNIINCDKPFVGSSVSEQAAQDTVNLAAIAFDEDIRDKPVTMGIISSLSPLQYASEMAEACIVYAENGQVNMCALLSQAGATAPVTLPGLLVTQNAEVLAGIILAQLVRAGAPCIYGTTSTVTDMRTGALAVGAPELSMIQNATQNMGHYYGLPTRGSGGISDTHGIDYQSGIESTLALTSTIMSGANFILHGCGIVGSYIAMSHEKYLLDEEIIGMLRRMLLPIDVTDERIDMDTIKQVGCGGEYLTNPQTFKYCRSEFFMPDLAQRLDYSSWMNKGSRDIKDIAKEKLEERLNQWEKPAIDSDIEARLADYVQTHTAS